MSNEFILTKSNSRDEIREILDEHCGNFAYENPEIIEYIRSEDMLDEIMVVIDEGLERAVTKVTFECVIDNFKVDIDVVVHNVRDGLNSKLTNNPDCVRVVRLKVYIQDLDTEERYVICDNVRCEIVMSTDK